MNSLARARVVCLKAAVLTTKAHNFKCICFRCKRKENMSAHDLFDLCIPYEKVNYASPHLKKNVIIVLDDERSQRCVKV